MGAGPAACRAAAPWWAEVCVHALCRANTRHVGHLSIPIPSSQEVMAAFSRDWLVLGRIEEPVAG